MVLDPVDSRVNHIFGHLELHELVLVNDRSMLDVFGNSHFEHKVAEIVEIIESPESTQVHKLIEGVLLSHHQNDRKVHHDGRVDDL